MALCVILIASVLGMVCAMPGGNALNITSQSCTLHLGGGLDKIAGHTDLTLSHDCNGGYAHTVVIGGELVDFYRWGPRVSCSRTSALPAGGHLMPQSPCQRCSFGSRRSGPQCLFPGDGGDTWCVTMQDQGGWHIAAFFQHGPLSG